MGADAEYLLSTVGPVLSQGVAECLIADPEDPVAFVGQWIKQYVKNAYVADQVRDEKAKDAARAHTLKAAAAVANSALQATISHKQAVIAQIADLPGYALDVWDQAAKSIVENTTAASAYVMAVAPEIEPEFAFPDEDEEVPESDDEQVPSAEEETPEEEPDPEADAAETEPAASPVDPETVKKDKWEYSKHHLQYAAAAPAHQTRLVVRTQLLERPPPVAEDEEEGKPQELVPITMKILDEHMPSLHVPNTLNEPRVKYHNGFPAIGAYCAATAGQASGQFSCILAADTLVPHGDGQPFSQADRDFVWDMSLAVAKRLEQFTADRISARLQPCMAPTIEEMKDTLKAIRKGPEQTEEQEETEGKEETAEPEEGAGEEEAAAPPDDDEELPELDPEADPAAQLEHYKKVVGRLGRKLAALQAPKANAQAHLDTEMKCMESVKEAVTARRDSALHELRSYLHAPPATWHVLKALFRLLKQDGVLERSWHQALAVVSAPLFDDVAKFDIRTDHDDASWKAVRCAYKAAGEPATALKRWQYEMPQSCMGAFLMLFIRQARKCLKAWTANEALNLEISTCESQKEQESEALAKAQEEVDKLAAEAAEAAAAAAEGVEGDSPDAEAEADE